MSQSELTVLRSSNGHSITLYGSCGKTLTRLASMLDNNIDELSQKETDTLVKYIEDSDSILKAEHMLRDRILADKKAVINELKSIAKKAAGVDLDIIISDDDKSYASITPATRTIRLSTEALYMKRLKDLILHECGHYSCSNLPLEDRIALIRNNWPSHRDPITRERIISLLQREDVHYFLNVLEDMIVNNTLERSQPGFKKRAFDFKVFPYADPGDSIVKKTAYYLAKAWLNDQISVPLGTDEDVEIIDMLARRHIKIYEACHSSDRAVVYGNLIPLLASSNALVDDTSRIVSGK